MANDSHPKLGNLSDTEVALVQKHRDDQHKLSGWRQGAQAVINVFDNWKPDGSLTPEVEQRHLRAEMRRAMDNPKVY